MQLKIIISTYSSMLMTEYLQESMELVNRLGWMFAMIAAPLWRFPLEISCRT